MQRYIILNKECGEYFIAVAQIFETRKAAVKYLRQCAGVEKCSINKIMIEM